MTQINKVCPKCGYDDVSLTFLKIGTRFYKQDKDYKLIQGYLGKENPSTSYTYGSAEISTECIKVHCRTCQFAWVTDVIDNTKSPINSTGLTENAFGLNAEEIEKFKKELQKSITDEIERNKFEYPGFPVYKEYPRDPLMPIPDGTGCPPMPNTPNTCDKIYLSNIDGIQFSYTPNILN